MKFESENYLKCQRYEDYKLTIDYKKLMKIAR